MTTLKTCFKCGETKPRSEFYAHRAMADGLLGKCKTCTRSDVAKNRALNIDRIRQYDKDRARLPHRAAMSANIVRRWKVENPERRAAQVALNNAVRDGKVSPQPCLICGIKAEAHHPDYSRPIDVVWLCPPHHRQAHAIARREP